MQKGWIKVYRDLLEKPWANKPNYVSVWFHLHLLMNHKPKEMLYMNTTITVQPGQLITSRASLREKTGVSESTVEKILKFFQKTGEIEQRTNSSFRLITIKNARRYLEKEQRTIQQENSEVYSEGTADDTLSKNVRMKEYNSSKEELIDRQHQKIEKKTELDMITFQALVESRSEEYLTFCQKVSESKNLPIEIVQAEFDKFINYWSEKSTSGRNRGKERWAAQQFFEVPRRLGTWFSNIKQPTTIASFND